MAGDDVADFEPRTDSQWDSVPLGDVTVFVNGDRGKNYPSQSDYVSRGIPFISAADLVDGRVDAGNCTFITEAAFDRLGGGKTKDGDLLFCLRGSLGKVARVRSIPRGAIASSLVIIRATDKTDENYLYYILSGPVGQRLAAVLNNGSVQPNISAGSLKQSVIPLPPLPEQKAIAAVLGALDDKIELNRRMNATLEAMARALFQSWFVDFDPVRAKLDGRQPPNLDPATADLFPEHFDHADGMLCPRGWELKPVHDCASFINGAAFKSQQFSSDGSGQPVVKIAELKDGISAQTKFTNEKLAPKYQIRDGEILFSWSGSPDTSIDTFLWTGGDGWLNQHIFKVEFHAPEEKHFVYYLLKRLKPIFIEIARNKQTTGLGHVTVQDMKRLKVAVPPKPILEAFQKIVQPIFDRTLATLTESRTLTTLRDTLLPKLLSGEVSLESPAVILSQ